MHFITLSPTSGACLRTRRCIKSHGSLFRISRRAILLQFDGQVCLHLAGSTGWTGWIPENELSITIDKQEDTDESLRTIPVSGFARYCSARG